MHFFFIYCILYIKSFVVYSQLSLIHKLINCFDRQSQQSFYPNSYKVITHQMSAQQKAADKQFKKAKQAITTSIFNWSKDYTSGASMFEQARTLLQSNSLQQKCTSKSKITTSAYQHWRNSSNATTPSTKAVSNIYHLQSSTWAVARNYQEILDIKLKHYPQTPTQQLIDIANNAFISFRMSQSTDKGLIVVAKLAKYLISRGDKKQGLQYLEQAYQIIIGEEKIFKKDQIFNQLVDIYMDNGAYEGIEKLYLEEIARRQGKDCEQMGLVVLVMILIQREPKRAEKKMYEIADMISSFLTSNECEAADELIKAYVKGEDERFRKLTTRAIITSIYPVSIVRKLREVTVPKMQEKNSSEEGGQKESDQIGELLF